MKFFIATKNAHKVIEFKRILEPMGIEVLCERDLDFELQDVEENGTTFEENAIIKAAAACEQTGFVSLADDSGLCVDALDGAPGIYSARYAGTGNDDDNNELLLKNLKGLPTEKRTARFVSCIACVFPDGREFTVRGACEGYILEEPQGNGGFGYDPVFFVPGLKKTFAQLSAEEKNSMSHRGRALEIFKGKLEDYLKK